MPRCDECEDPARTREQLPVFIQVEAGLMAGAPVSRNFCSLSCAAEWCGAWAAQDEPREEGASKP